MKSLTILLLLGLIAFDGHNSANSGLVNADVKVEDLGEEVEKKPADESKKKYTAKGSTKTPEEREKIKKQKKEEKQKLESCLVITRSYYKLYEDTFETYLNNHKSVQGKNKEPVGGVTKDTPKELREEIEQGRSNHSMLLSKINAQMLLKCEENISQK